MAVIGQRNWFSFGVGKFLSIANEDLVRPLPFGNNWNALRIGVLIALDNQTAQSMPGAWLVIGVCSGTNSPFNSPTCANFAGWANFSSPNTWSYNAGGGIPYYTTPGNQYGIAKRNGVVSTGLANGISLWLPVGPWTPRRAVLIIYIIKGSPNYVVYSAYADSTTPDWTLFNFLDMMDQQITQPAALGVTLTASAGANLPTDEGPGPLNTLNISWNRQAFPLEIYALAVARVS